MKRLLPLLLAALVGCTATVSQQEISAAHFGAPPKNYQATAKHMLAGRINDPGAAKYRFIPPARGFALIAGQKRFGYLVKAYVNVKNGKGEYIGEVVYYFLFSGAKSWDVTDLFSFGRARFIDTPKE